MKKKDMRFNFMHKEQIYTAVYENGFAPLWAIYKGTRVIEKNYVCGYDGWGETMLPTAVLEKFKADHP